MIVAIIQARMGSTRLPGKVMLPLSGRHVLDHVTNRVGQASRIDSLVVATSEEQQDDIIARFAPKFDAKLYRGPEADVLERLFGAAAEHDADTVVRITADCPLLAPTVIDSVVDTLDRTGADYASNIEHRTFPRGLDVEAFTFESFEQVREEATDPHYREHVTPYYREESTRFTTRSVSSEQVFDDPQLQNRSDLRLTLDEAADYEVLHTIYENVTFDEILPISEAIRYVDEDNLMDLNASVEQKSH